MDESDAIDALEHLGLTGYEAQVFVALQKLGVGSASDVHRVADVPRSQVYGAAERLEERGLVEVQQSSPIQYRPIALDEARERLRTRYERHEERAFSHLEALRAEANGVEEHPEDVWMLHGHDAVAGRAEQLLADAAESILYAGGPEALDESVVETLRERASAGVDVSVVSASDSVIERFADVEGVAVQVYPSDLAPQDKKVGRTVIVDGDTVLISTLGADAGAETAIWSTKTGFADFIIRLLNAWFANHLGV